MDPLGLSQRGLSSSRAVTLTVLPRVEPLATLMPHGLNWLDYETAAQSIVTGSSMLRRYQQGDDLRRVHWRTTARVGALVVRDGGESDDPERRATTVLLDAGGPATPPEEMDRAVEVAASVLSSAAHPSWTGVSGAYRLVTTAGWDSGAQHRDDGLEDTLVALAALGPAPFPAWNASQRRSAGSGERTETSCFLWSAPSGNLLQIAPFLNTSPGGTPAS